MTREQTRENDVLYRRTLPGGGFVIIRATRVTPLVGRAHYHGEVIVERRGEAHRRHGHVAPAVVRYDGPTRQAVMHELFPVAHSNAALAVACMAHRSRHGAHAHQLVAV